MHEATGGGFTNGGVSCSAGPVDPATYCTWGSGQVAIACDGNNVVVDIHSLQTSSGTIPTSIGCLTGLTSLDLSSVPMHGLIPNEIGNLINLRGLKLAYTNLAGVLPTEICKLTKLTLLYIYVSQITCYPSCVGSFITTADDGSQTVC